MTIFQSLKFSLIYWSHTVVGTVLFIVLMGCQAVKYGPMSFFRETKRNSRPAILENQRLGTHRFLKTDDASLHYVESGDPTRPLMMLIHGFPDCWYTWREQILAFQKHYRVVAVDTRGCGESGKPPKTSDYSADKVAGDLKSLIDTLGYDSCILIGHDWGGIVCWYFANMFPEMTDKVIIMNAPHPNIFIGALMNSWQQRMNSLYMFFFQVPWLPEAFMKWNDYALLDKPTKQGERPFFTREEVEALKYSMSRPGTRTAYFNYYRANVDATMFTRRPIECPVFIIWGMKDKFLAPFLLDGTEDLVSDLKIHKMEDAGHWVHQNQSLKVNQLVLEYLRCN